MTAAGWALTTIAAGAALIAADVILHRIAQGAALRAQDEPAHTSHDQEQEDAWTAVDVGNLLNGWDHEAELGPCARHGIRRCTICLGEHAR